LQGGEPQEVKEIRQHLDETLLALGKRRCHTVANTIFPAHLWRRSAGRQGLYAKFNRITPKLKRRPINRNGLYFERMTAYGSGRQDGNQIEHMIKAYTECGVHRATALVLNVFNPARDHTNQRRRGSRAYTMLCSPCSVMGS
jgi:hypothetical protein